MTATDKPPPGRIIRLAYITRALVQSNRETIFVFGDNMERRGYGGQAAAMRGEPNTIGVPTKWRPERDEGAYFRDEDWQNSAVRSAITTAFDRMANALAEGVDVVIPANGLGTGLAQLPQRAPKINTYIEGCIANLAVPREQERIYEHYSGLTREDDVEQDRGRSR
jgi:hypothetical protein